MVVFGSFCLLDYMDYMLVWTNADLTKEWCMLSVCLSFIHALTQPHKPSHRIRPSCPGSGFSLNTCALVYLCYVTVLLFFNHTHRPPVAECVCEPEEERHVVDGSKCRCLYPGQSVSAEVCRAQELGQLFCAYACVCQHNVPVSNVFLISFC